MWGCPVGTIVPYNSRTKVPSQYQQTLAQDTASHPRRPASHKHCCTHIISHRLLNILTVLNHWPKQNQNLRVLTKFNLHFKQVQSPNFFDNLATAILVLTHQTLNFITITFKKIHSYLNKKECTSITRTKWLQLYMEIISTYFMNHTKCWQIKNFHNIKARGRYSYCRTLKCSINYF